MLLCFIQTKLKFRLMLALKLDLHQVWESCLPPLVSALRVPWPANTDCQNNSRHLFYNTASTVVKSSTSKQSSEHILDTSFRNASKKVIVRLYLYCFIHLRIKGVTSALHICASDSDF